MGSVSRVVEEAFKGQIIVKLFGGQEYEQSQFHTINEYNRRQNMRLAATQALSTPILRLIVGFALAGVIYIATNDEIMEIVSVGTITSYMFAMAMLTAPVKRLSDINADLQRGIAAAESVFKLVDMDEEKSGGSYTKDRVNGKIEFSNVSFRYATGDSNALSDISLTIQPGQTVAFVGRSGSGKTSLLNLLPRFYDYHEGSVKLDDHEIDNYQLYNLRSQFAYVGQDIVLFNDSVEHNISYGSFSDATHEQVKQAAKQAYADDFINEMSDGYETIVGERGVMLSGGQRQRVAIARALLKNAPILILDEATSALDTESERYIQSSLDKLMRNRTTLVIAHRLSTIENADVIVVMDDGKIVETGSHQELIKNNGLYSSLHKMQFRETSTDNQVYSE